MKERKRTNEGNKDRQGRRKEFEKEREDVL
jgi:hypothetical protein